MFNTSIRKRMKHRIFILIVIQLALLDCNKVFSQILNDKIADTSFVNLKDYSSEFIYDMKYATQDNFLKSQVYECAECYLRFSTVKALIAANASFQELGFRLKIFDCYRPLSIQKKMWAIAPNPAYVANPARGSIHNRGGAVDVTLVQLDGTPLDFGTDFDFFGVESAHSFKNLPKSVKQNRKLLKKVMEKNGFKAMASEWWHYNFVGALNEPVSNFTWQCN